MEHQISNPQTCGGRPNRLLAELRAPAAAVLLVFLVVLLTACVSHSNSSSNDRGDSVTSSAEKNGDGKLRKDMQPLTDRFPELRAASSATWLSGTMGDSGVPSPSTYWIDAVVVLPPTAHSALREVADDTAATLPEGFSSALQSFVPAGRLLASAELTALFSQDGFASSAVLVDDGSTLILSSLFE